MGKYQVHDPAVHDDGEWMVYEASASEEAARCWYSECAPDDCNRSWPVLVRAEGLSWQALRMTFDGERWTCAGRWPGKVRLPAETPEDDA